MGVKPSPRVVVMGVSGCGKSSVGNELAALLEVPFIEGDSLHSARNVALMAAGTPLTDADRRDWLLAVAERLRAATEGVVVSCSALKRSYRDLLRHAAPELRLVFLHGPAELLHARLAARQGHYMPPSLLQSQLQTLEPPSADEAALGFAITEPVQAIAQAACAQLKAIAA